MKKPPLALATALVVGTVSLPAQSPSSAQRLGTPVTEALGATELPEVVVSGALPAYAVPTSTTSTRLETPNLDLPRTIQVIPHEVIEDRGVVRAGELADNVPGVAQATGYGGLSSAEYFLRGFRSESTFRDGFRDFAFLTPVDVAGIDRVEFLKGPASVLYGLIQPGGLVNVISKRPLSTPRYAGEVQVGSFDFYRTSFDLGGPLLRRDPLSATIDPKGGQPLETVGSPVLSYRLNTAYENAGSYRDYNKSESYYAAPNVLWNITPQTSLWLYGEYQHYNYTFDRGLPPLPQTFRLPISRFLGEPGDFSHATTWRGGYELIHHFNDDWQFRSALGVIHSEMREEFFQGFNLDTDERTLLRDVTKRHEISDNVTLQNDFSGRFKLGPIQNQALVGVELSRYRFAYDIGEVGSTGLDIYDPHYGTKFGNVPYDPKQSYGADMLGIYAQDLITLLPQLKLNLAGRYDNADTVEHYRPSAKTRHSDQAFSPQVGLVYQPWKAISLFASWSRSFNPNFGLSRTATSFAPERGEQFEGGLKFETPDQRLSGVLSVYHITKEHVLATDPTDTNFSIITGEQTSRGFEASVIGQPVPGWKVLGSYSYTDAYVSEDTSIPVGNRLAGAPRNQLGLWTSYEVQSGKLRGLGAGVGAYYFSEAEATLPNSGVDIPAWWRFDAAIFYRREHWKAQLNLKNLADKRYYASQGYELTPQAPFTLLATVGFEY